MRLGVCVCVCVCVHACMNVCSEVCVAERSGGEGERQRVWCI